MAKLIRNRSEKIRSFILANVEDHSQNITTLTAKEFGISRQAAFRHVQALRDEGLLTSTGSKRKTVYTLKPLEERTLQYPLTPKLEEHEVWKNSIHDMFSFLPRNIFDICNYGFSGMLNNARDHSEGTQVLIHSVVTHGYVSLLISDDGLGIFNKIQRAFSLEDPRFAILELAKGKLTTDPDHHTGEGIFFTSRMFDEFSILSGNLFFSHKTDEDDWLIETKAVGHKGTAVSMKIKTRSPRTVQEVFEMFASVDDEAFTRTHVPVSLYKYGDENLVSRSQAKRLLARFDKFKEVFLDFQGVSTMGRAFADEIFRVFRETHPDVNLVYVRTTKKVKRIILQSLATASASIREERSPNQLRLDLGGKEKE